LNISYIKLKYISDAQSPIQDTMFRIQFQALLGLMGLEHILFSPPHHYDLLHKSSEDQEAMYSRKMLPLVIFSV